MRHHWPAVCVQRRQGHFLFGLTWSSADQLCMVREFPANKAKPAVCHQRFLNGISGESGVAVKLARLPHGRFRASGASAD